MCIVSLNSRYAHLSSSHLCRPVYYTKNSKNVYTHTPTHVYMQVCVYCTHNHFLCFLSLSLSLSLLQLLVVFYNRHQDFEIVTVPSYASASDILDDRDLSVQLDISGIANRGLFLKTQDDEHMFMNLESPCDVLFEVDEDSVLRRRPMGMPEIYYIGGIIHLRTCSMSRLIHYSGPDPSGYYEKHTEACLE